MENILGIFLLFILTLWCICHQFRYINFDLQWLTILPRITADVLPPLCLFIKSFSSSRKIHNTDKLKQWVTAIVLLYVLEQNVTDTATNQWHKRLHISVSQQLGGVHAPQANIFTARRSYASAVLGVVILVCPSVRLSHACFVTNPKNLPEIFLYHMKGQSF